MNQSYEGTDEHYGGYFDLGDGVSVAGRIQVCRRKTRLSLFSQTPIKKTLSDNATVLGTLEDGRKVTLLQCVQTGMTRHSEEQTTLSWTMQIFPNIIILGPSHLPEDAGTIALLSIHLPDAEVLFDDYGTFGWVLDPAKKIKGVVEPDPEGLEAQIGERPEIFYFTGKNEVFSALFEEKTISAVHLPTISLPSTRGIRLDNKVWLTIDYPTPVGINDALSFASRVAAYMEIVVGRAQPLLEITATTGGESDRQDFEIYFCMEQATDAHEQAQSVDNLMHASRDHNHFSTVFQNWLDRDADYLQSRLQFRGLFSRQREYDSDKLVAAANMFDTMPDSAFPAKLSLDDAILCAKKSAKTLFKALPETPERNSILNALGRIGSNTLKRKIGYRVKIVSQGSGDNFPSLDKVASAAVDCRNFLVHGTPTKIDYIGDFELFGFLTDTLIFVYGVSDLIESGWDIKKWLSGPSTGSHPFASYRANYSYRIAHFENATQK